MGNHDARIAFDMEVVPFAKHSSEERAARLEAIEWSKRTVTATNKSFLAGFPRRMQIPFGAHNNTQTLELVHASTRGIGEYIYEDHVEESLRSMLGSVG